MGENSERDHHEKEREEEIVDAVCGCFAVKMQNLSLFDPSFESMYLFSVTKSKF